MLVASNDFLMKKIALKGSVLSIYNGQGFYISIDPEGCDIWVVYTDPVPNLLVGDVVTVYGVFEKIDCLPQEIYQIIIRNALLEK